MNGIIGIIGMIGMIWFSYFLIVNTDKLYIIMMNLGTLHNILKFASMTFYLFIVYILYVTLDKNQLTMQIIMIDLKLLLKLCAGTCGLFTIISVVIYLSKKIL